MADNLYRSIEEPIRKALTWEELWKASDNGLIACWEQGRLKAVDNSDLVELCKSGGLPVLAWKGGVDKKIKGKKYGSLFYLATWKGLRGEDLNINLQEEITLICSRTQVEVLFTSKLLSYETSKQEELES
ncbi:MAG: hypothetical protein V4545_03660 [Pseudomonadota bacterium]